MSPYERIINLIEEDITYTLTDLETLSRKAGYFVSRRQIYFAAKKGKIPYTQFGDRGRLEIEGRFFLDYIKLNSIKRINSKNRINKP
jgi:hypothetical protein